MVMFAPSDLPVEPKNQPPDDKRVVYRYIPSKEDNVTGHDDIAEEYAVEAWEDANSGICVYAKYHGRWEPNPFSCRALIRQLLIDLGVKV